MIKNTNIAVVSVDEAESIILEHALYPIPASCGLGEVSGRFLSEDILADRNIPPFDRVTMDGIAVSTQKHGTSNPEKTFTSLGVHPAGASPPELKSAHECWEVMTGAVLPWGANCVIPFEELTQHENIFQIKDTLTLSPGLNIHQKGIDSKKGDCLIGKGVQLAGPHLAVAASVGKTQLKVSRPPSCLMITTGDELVPVRGKPLPHQIRQSNGLSIQAAAKNLGYEHLSLVHLSDDPDIIEERLKILLNQFSIVILSGGVSKGYFDWVPEVLDKLGVTTLFHGIKQKPGKPFWFGTWENITRVFGLPGNPVSALVCFRRYIYPFLLKSMGGLTPERMTFRLSGSVSLRPGRTYFVPVQIVQEDGLSVGRVVAMNGSGDFVGLAKSDGFLQIPDEEITHLDTSTFSFFPWQ